MADDIQGSPPASGFRASLDRAQFATFKWLLLGHLLFVAGLFAIMLHGEEIGEIWIATPLYALPLLIFGSRDQLWARLLVMLLGFTVAHYLAVYVAVQFASGVSPLVPGALGGLVGGVPSLLLCLLFGLTAHNRQTTHWMLLGALLLAVIGSLCVYAYILALDANMGADSFVVTTLKLLLIYTPWQLAFAYVLAKLLR